MLQNLGAERLPFWHYAVLIGYDAEKNLALLRSGKRERVEMRWQRFAATWHRGGRWAITTLMPGVMPGHADPARFIEAAAGLEAAGRHAEAGAAYDAAITRWPREPRAWLGRGNVAYVDGNLVASAEAYVRAIAISPRDAAARNNLAQVLVTANCLPEARRQLARATAFAEGTALATAVLELRTKMESMPEPDVACAFGDHAWPD